MNPRALEVACRSSASPGQPSVVLRLEDISVQFGPNFILESVSFQIGDRERVAIVGRNGAGRPR